MNFKKLISNILNTHEYLQSRASKAINVTLSVRNWLIGYYIVEYEQNGEDRAKYGAKIIEQLALELKDSNIRRTEARELRRYRLFYHSYPQIAKFFSENYNLSQIRESVSPKLKNTKIRESASPKLFEKLQLSAQDIFDDLVPASKLLNNLSFSHLNELIIVDDKLKRTFYEIECIKGSWSVRELKRQIDTLYFERSGLSKDKKAMSKLINQNIILQKPIDVIKDLYFFEFLDLPQTNTLLESTLEQALLNSFTEFIMELGISFCLESRQKRILIGDEYFFIDLVFYHRILRCHILVEIKTKAFKHHNASQLNTYLNYYKTKVTLNNENQPIGILLVAKKNNELVEFAIGGLDKNLFVQQYLIELPDKKQLEKFIKTELNKL